MRKSLLALGLSVLFFSCKEHLEVLPGSGPASSDTTYTAGVETPQQRNVLIEEYTGVTCPRCPEGRQYIRSYETQYPGRIIAVGYYPYNQPQSNPVYDLTKQDFRSDKATTLGEDYLGGVFFLPAAAIDRSPFTGGAYISDRNQWAGKVADRINVATPVNIYVTSAYDAATHQATIKVKAAFTQAVQKKVMLSVNIIENEIIDAQEYYDGNFVVKDTFYQHDHVMRDILTQTFGTPILNNITIDAGRVYERTFTYTIGTAWNPEHCKIVAFISTNETGDKEVLQAAEAGLE